MPVTVKTFATPSEAAAALSSDRGARYLGGGTLVMRALNEGDVSISTIVRVERSALTRIDAIGRAHHDRRRRHLRADLAERELAFLHAPARSIGGPAVRNMGTVGGNLFAPAPYGDLHRRAARARRDGLGAGRLWRARHGDRGISASRANGTPARWCWRLLHGRRAPRPSAIARSPASSRRAVRSSRSPRICRSAAAGSAARASRSARWRRRRSAPRPPSARSKARHWTHAAIARRCGGRR